MTMSSPPKPAAAQNDKYREVEVIRADDGLCIQITQNDEKGRISFAVCREYDRDDRVVRTAFMGARHVETLRGILDKVAERLDYHEDRARAAVRRTAGSR